MKGRKNSKKITDLTCEELQTMIGDEIIYNGKLKKIGALYFYINKNGIVLIRIRFVNTSVFVNVKSVYKKNEEIVFELKE